MPSSDAYDFPKRAVPSVRIIDKTGSRVVVTNTVTETTLYARRLPGNTLGATGKLRLTMLGSVTDTSVVVTGADGFTIRCKLGATTLVSPVVWTSVDGGAVHNSIGTDQPVKLVLDIAALPGTPFQIALAVLDTVMVSDVAPGVVVSVGVASDAASAHVAHRIDRGVSAIELAVATVLAITAQWSVAQTTKVFIMDSVLVEEA